jgi:hypothetical protein
MVELYRYPLRCKVCGVLTNVHSHSKRCPACQEVAARDLARERQRRCRARRRVGSGVPETMACAHCGVEFQPLRTRARFCSTKCRVYDHRARKPSKTADRGKGKGKDTIYLYWSRCRLGPKRFYWVVWAVNMDQDRQETILADGYLPTSWDAMMRAEEEFKRLFDAEKYVRYGHYDGAAARIHRQKCRAGRAQKGTNGTGAVVREYLYAYHRNFIGRGSGTGDWWGPPIWEAYPILKKTAKRIWVPDQLGIPLEDIGTDREQKIFDRIRQYPFLRRDSDIVLDRQALERDGQIYAPKHGRLYHLRPVVSVEDPWEGFVNGLTGSPAAVTDQELAQLGITTWPCSKAEVKDAYRRASKTMHPDAGGSEDAFVRLRVAYERLLAVATG